MMDGEAVLMGILPLVAAVALAAVSLRSLFRDPRGVQLLLGLPALLLLAGAIPVLVRMLAGAWPTILPHVAVALAIPLVAAQALLARASGRGP